MQQGSMYYPPQPPYPHHFPQFGAMHPQQPQNVYSAPGQPRPPRRRVSKMDREEVWPEDVEQAFREALRDIPKMGRRKVVVNNKPCGRNELIANYIYAKTGRIRSRKQVSSHIQVCKNLGIIESNPKRRRSSKSQDNQDDDPNASEDDETSSEEEDSVTPEREVVARKKPALHVRVDNLPTHSRSKSSVGRDEDGSFSAPIQRNYAPSAYYDRSALPHQMYDATPGNAKHAIPEYRNTYDSYPSSISNPAQSHLSKLPSFAENGLPTPSSYVTLPPLMRSQSFPNQDASFKPRSIDAHVNGSKSSVQSTAEYAYATPPQSQHFDNKEEPHQRSMDTHILDENAMQESPCTYSSSSPNDLTDRLAENAGTGSLDLKFLAFDLKTDATPPSQGAQSIARFVPGAKVAADEMNISKIDRKKFCTVLKAYGENRAPMTHLMVGLNVKDIDVKNYQSENYFESENCEEMVQFDTVVVSFGKDVFNMHEEGCAETRNGKRSFKLNFADYFFDAFLAGLKGLDSERATDIAMENLSVTQIIRHAKTMEPILYMCYEFHNGDGEVVVSHVSDDDFFLDSKCSTTSTAPASVSRLSELAYTSQCASEGLCLLPFDNPNAKAVPSSSDHDIPTPESVHRSPASTPRSSDEAQALQSHDMEAA